MNITACVDNFMSDQTYYRIYWPQQSSLCLPIYLCHKYEHFCGQKVYQNYMHDAFEAKVCTKRRVKNLLNGVMFVAAVALNGFWYLVFGRRYTTDSTISHFIGTHFVCLPWFCVDATKNEESTTLQHSKNSTLFFSFFFVYNLINYSYLCDGISSRFGLRDVSRCVDRVKGCCRFHWQYKRKSKSKKWCALSRIEAAQARVSMRLRCLHIWFVRFICVHFA